MHLPHARAVSSLRSRNVRLFLAGRSVSLIGIWIQHVAMSWLVYRLTGSPLLLGLLGADGRRGGRLASGRGQRDPRDSCPRSC